MLKTIFISYGRDEQNLHHVELVKRVKSDLEEVGFTVLMDLERLHTGEDWQLKLENDIAISEWVLFFITPYSARRPDGYCLNELSYALYKKKSIAPIMINFIEPPLSICRIQYLDLQKIKDEVVYKKKMEEIIDVLNEDKVLGFEGGHTALHNSLDPLKFESTISKHIYGFVGRKWIYDKVDQWLIEKTESRVLYITANAGYGKSALATYLSKTHPSSTSIHFCQHDAKATIDPKNILKTFIFELSTQIPQYHEKLQGLNIKGKLKGSAVDIFRELLEEPLTSIDRPEKDLFFIIDGLDEANDEDGKNPLVDMIARRFSDLPIWLNIIITSRPEPELMRKLKKFNPLELKANEQNNFNDLELFITQKLDKKLDSVIINSLIEKSDGNMLYLKMMLEHDTVKNGNFTLQNIAELPAGMEEFYQQYFERKFDDVDEYEENLLLLVNILVASQEGMTEPLIKYILEINDRKYKKILESFGSLLEKSHNKLSFYHKSLFDWLSDYDKSGNYSADIDEGNKLLTQRLWKLYNEDDDLQINYETYLLQALYYTKSYEKLEIVLKDILFIARMYNQHAEELYKSILSSAIKKYSKKYDVALLKIYDSFLREKDHLITTLDDDTWKPSQSLFQLAYEDGENSPLSAAADKLLEEEKIHFLWLKNKNRPKKFLRSGVLKVMKEHTAAVNGVIELSDGNLLSYSKDNTLRLWNSEGTLQSVLKEHVSSVENAIELSNGSILSYSRDNAIILWNSTGISTAKMIVQTSLIISVLKPDNSNKLSYPWNKTIRLWNDKSTAQIECEKNLDNLNEIIKLDKGNILSYEVDSKTLKLWNRKGSVQTILKGHTDFIVGAIELSNGNIISYSKDNTLRLWDSEGKSRVVMQGHTNIVEGAIELDNGNIVSYSSDRTLRLWSSEGILQEVMQGHRNYINGVTQLRNGNIISYSTDEDLRLWDNEGILQTVMHGHSHWITGITELDNGNIISYSWDTTLILWDNKGRKLTTLQGHTDHVNGAIELANGNLLSYSEDKTLRLWDVESINQIPKEKYISSVKSAIELSNGNILSCSMDNSLSLWNSEGVLQTILKGHTSDVHNAIELNNGNILSYSWDKTLRLWDKEGTLLNVLKGHFNLIEYARLINDALGLSNGNIISYGEGETTLRLWDDKGKFKKVMKGHTNVINGVIELNDNNILSYALDKTLRLWNSEGILQTVLKGHADNINGAIKLSNNNLISYSKDHTLILWSKEGILQVILKGHTDSLNGVLELKNGNLLSYSMDNTLRLWDKNGKLIKLLEAHTDSVIGAIELQNENILSYSNDDTIIIYKPNGELQSVLKSAMKNVEGVLELDNGHLLSYSRDRVLRIWSPQGKVIYRINILSKFVEPKYIEKFKSSLVVIGNYNNIYFYKLKYGNKSINFNELTEKKMEFYNDEIAK